jgi:hypothetical protein
MMRMRGWDFPTPFNPYWWQDSQPIRWSLDSKQHPMPRRHHMKKSHRSWSNLEALLSHGKEHFSQASNTPFVLGPIAKFLAPQEWNKVSEQILAGTFDINSITDHVNVWDIVKAMSPAPIQRESTMATGNH